jgi:hypothetical protein
MLDSDLFTGRYLLPGEDPDEFLALVEEYRRRYPGDLVIDFYVTCMIHDEWSLRRYRRILHQIIERVRTQHPGAEIPPEIDNRSFQRLQQTIARLQSSYNSALRAIKQIQKHFPLDEKKPTSAKLGSFRQKPAQAGGPFLVTPPPPKTKPN